MQPTTQATEAPAAAPRLNSRDIAKIRQRLDRWELTHLRSLSASLDDQLTAATNRAEAAESHASAAEHRADFWQENARELQTELVDLLGDHAAPGLTQDGHLVVVNTITPPPIGQHWPEQGGIYLGLAPAEGTLPDRHLIALDATPGKKLNWQAAKDWAHALGNGARLPTQLEAMLAWTLAPKAFKPTHHWTGTQLSSGSAFVQVFEGGDSYWYSKDHEHVVVPFRGLALQTFTPLEAAPAETGGAI